MNHASRLLAGFALGLSLGLVAGESTAQSYPTKPIRLVVPLAPGGGTDLWARFVGARMGEILGQQMLIENRPGGGTIIAADAVAKSPADGYTILLATSTTLAYNPSLYKKLPYDPGEGLRADRAHHAHAHAAHRRAGFFGQLGQRIHRAGEIEAEPDGLRLSGPR